MAPSEANYRHIKKRVRRTLNYGSRHVRGPHLPLSELMVDYFNKASPFDYLKPDTSAAYSSSGFTDTCALVVAMCYLERMRTQQKEAFEATSPADMYLPALVLASKYLHDSDQDERVSNTDWAILAGMEPKELADLEWQFVKNIDWNVAVTAEDFEKRLRMMESWVAANFLSRNSFCTYNEATILSDHYATQLLSSVRAFLGVVANTMLLYLASVASVVLLLNSAHAPSSSLSMASNSTSSRHAALLSLDEPLPSPSSFEEPPSSPEWNLDEEEEEADSLCHYPLFYSIPNETAPILPSPDEDFARPKGFLNLLFEPHPVFC